MNFKEYQLYFKKIIDTPIAQQAPPYTNPDYLNYAKLNWSRMNRWFKTAKLTDTIIETIKNIQEPQYWTIITEPWCGDAAHNIPFMEMIALHNPKISIAYELRDSAPYNIEKYLTNGSKSIPKLIIRDKNRKDINTWGPRPKDCQTLYSSLNARNATLDTIKLEIQNWYNKNKGVDIQNELNELLIGKLEERLKKDN